ncbi:14065_t:CDS:2, partial [Gigaspora rosea]
STNSEINLTYTEQIAQKKRRTNWKLNCTRFSNLSQMAKDYLVIQFTSVPSEQAFSKAGNTVQAKRTRLSDKSIQAFMCINSWLKHGIRFRRG